MPPAWITRSPPPLTLSQRVLAGFQIAVEIVQRHQLNLGQVGWRWAVGAMRSRPARHRIRLRYFFMRSFYRSAAALRSAENNTLQTKTPYKSEDL
jgi:hypothetical protein